MQTRAIGIDIGGTTIKGALVDRDGNWSDEIRIETATVDRGPGMLDVLVRIVAEIIEKEGGIKNIRGVGIGTPGFVDRNGTIIGKAVNLPGWEGTRLYGPIRERFGLNAVAANDATAAALAEARFGAARGVENAVFFFLGTGIGGGIVSGGRLQYGSRGMAGEFGHLSIDYEGLPCGCGQKGCVERYASGPAIVYWAQSICGSRDVERTDFVKRVGAQGEPLTAKLVYEFVNKGDAVALRLNDFVCDRLARAIGAVITMLSPNRVVLGGGVMMAGQVIVDTVKKHLPRYSLPETLQNCDIRSAQLGEKAGVIGAGALVFEEFDHGSDDCAGPAAFGHTGI
jgi:glucokinase